MSDLDKNKSDIIQIKMILAAIQTELKSLVKREELVELRALLSSRTTFLDSADQVREPVLHSAKSVKKFLKNAQKTADKASIIGAIAELLSQDYSTTEMYHEIVEQQKLCKKTAFFKYLKLVREKKLRSLRTG